MRIPTYVGFALMLSITPPFAHNPAVASPEGKAVACSALKDLGTGQDDGSRTWTTADVVAANNRFAARTSFAGTWVANRDRTLFVAYVPGGDLVPDEIAAAGYSPVAVTRTRIRLNEIVEAARAGSRPQSATIVQVDERLNRVRVATLDRRVFDVPSIAVDRGAVCEDPMPQLVDNASIGDNVWVPVLTDAGVAGPGISLRLSGSTNNFRFTTRCFTASGYLGSEGSSLLTERRTNRACTAKQRAQTKRVEATLSLPLFLVPGANNRSNVLFWSPTRFVEFRRAQ